MFVLFLFLFVTDVFGYHLADLTLSANPQEKSEFTYEKCLSMKKVFHEDRCWDLLTKGPCDDGQWLVLEWSDDDQQEQPVRAKCARRQCNGEDVYWPWDGLCYDLQVAHRQQLCPRSDTEVAIDEFGDGYCECRNGGKVPYVRIVSSDDDEDSQPCYPMYSKGPCPQGHIITPFGWGYGSCTEDKCAVKWAHVEDSSPLIFQRQRVQPTVVQWSDGQCYVIGTQGPCSGNQQFTVLRDSMRPGCVSPVTELDMLSAKTWTTACKTDHRGVCVDAVNATFNDPSYGFEERLRESAKRYSKRDKKKKKKRTA